MIDVHAVAPVQLSYAVLPQMMKNNEGNIINVSSMAGLDRGRGIYGGTKKFLVDFSYYLVKVVKGCNINIQAICPGYTYSGFHKTDEYKKNNVNAYKSIPKWVWMDANDVVDISLKKLGRRKILVIPGFKNKILMQLLKTGIISARSSASRQKPKSNDS